MSFFVVCNFSYRQLSTRYILTKICLRDETMRSIFDHESAVFKSAALQMASLCFEVPLSFVEHLQRCCLCKRLSYWKVYIMQGLCWISSIWNCRLRHWEIEIRTKGNKFWRNHYYLRQFLSCRKLTQCVGLVDCHDFCAHGMLNF